jgi:aminoglycoside adenylyltransferase-like protein/nucleotidyltransferase-like protein
MADVKAYLAELSLRAQATADVVGVYVGGSYALGAYQPGRSDLDVAVVTPGSIAWPIKDALVARLRHETFPCPARGLELVVYSAADAASTGVAPAFQLNLNTGAAMPFRVDVEPDPAEGHWFAIDRAILRNHAVVLVGPPPQAVFGSIPRRLLLTVIADALGWHLGGPASTSDAVLNACRALRFAVAGDWSSKASAGWWALDYVAEREVVREALAARTGSRPPGEREARAFVEGVVGEIELVQALEGRNLRARV